MNHYVKKSPITVTHPDVAAQWHPTLNGDARPEQFTHGSKKEFWWLGDCGHHWYSPIDKRIRGHGCHYCNNRVILKGFNDCETLSPEIVSLWDHEKNEEYLLDKVFKGNRTKSYWKCERDHSWFAEIRSLALNGSRCPQCSRHHISANNSKYGKMKKRLLIDTLPDIEKFIFWEKNSGLDISDTGVGSPVTVTFRCPDDHRHVWTETIKHFTDRALKSSREKKCKCPLCIYTKIVTGVNDLGTEYPDVAGLWNDAKNDIPVSEVSPREADKRRHWICDQGHEWFVSVEDMVKKRSPGRWCTVCSGKKILAGFNDFPTLRPEIMELWDHDKNSEEGVFPEGLPPSSKTPVWWTCDKGHSWTVPPAVITDDFCHVCHRGRSRGEVELGEFIRSILPDNVSVVINDRSVISPLELDVYIPEKNIAIEFNGLYWHSDLMDKISVDDNTRNQIDQDTPTSTRNRHHYKWKRARERGVQLITVWEDDWRDRKDTVKSMLAHKLGISDHDRIYARKTSIRYIDYAVSSKFLNQHHIQGSTLGSVHMALEHDGDIVAVSVWRKNKDTLYLDRYATSVNVIGGMGKLLKEGIKWGRAEGLTEIVTFADHEVSDGGLYNRLGFSLDKELEPDYSYIVSGRRRHKFGYRLKRFKNDPDLEYQEGLTERELAELNDIPRVWDSGKSRYVIVLD